MKMKTSITGKNIAKEMKDLAKATFEAYPRVACVCVAVKHVGGRASSGRAIDGGTRHAYVAVSGATGRQVLRDNLIDERAANASLTIGELTGLLTTMAGTLNVYQSKKRGSTAIVQQESWVTHNCAESNLALFLYQLGVNHSQVVIASYEKTGDTVQYKPLCHNCAQWVRQRFKVLSEFDQQAKKTV